MKFRRSVGFIHARGSVWSLVCAKCLSSTIPGSSTSTPFVPAAADARLSKSHRKATMHFGVDDSQKLNLNLQLDGVDFASMAAATKSALQQERKSMLVGLKMSSVIPQDAIEKMTLESHVPLHRPSVQGDNARDVSSSSSSLIRSVRGIVNAGEVHDSRDTRVAYRQLRVENPNLRYTLRDALQDCALTNNWAKAYGIFDSAVHKAVDSVPAALLLAVDGNEGEGCAHPSSPQEGPSGVENERAGQVSPSRSSASASRVASSGNAFLSSSPATLEDKAFSMLFNMNATSPPMPLPRKNATDSPSASPSSTFTTTPLPGIFHPDGEEGQCRDAFSPTSDATEERSGVPISMPSSGRIGIMRWRGFHFCALLSLLMQCHRWKEVDRVWDVLKKTGFLSFHMDEVMVNRLIASIRRAIHSSTGDNRKHGSEESVMAEEGEDSVLESSSLYDLTSVEDGGEALEDDLHAPYAEEKRMALQLELDMTAKTTARKMLIDTEWIAKKKGFRVHKMNAMTVQQARIAEAMRRSQEPLDKEEAVHRNALDEEKIRTDGYFRNGKNGKEQPVQEELRSKEEVEDALAMESPPSSLPVRVDAGDFNGLLRRASSYSATVQILNVMDQLSVERSAETFANMIAALQNPLYLVNGASEEELQTNYGTDGTFQRMAEASHPERYSVLVKKREGGQGIGVDANPPAPRLSPVDIEVAKEKYERYKEKRIQEAKGWFEQCPVSMRSAMVFNEYLYLIRGKEYVKEYTRVLILFRGNAIFADETLLHNRPTQKDRSTSHLSSSSSASSATILPPQWKTPPDAKTYEALLFRLRYLHQWDAMWELLQEMRAEKIYGTPRTYQMLISEAKVHPPQSSSMNTAVFSPIHY